MHRRVHSVARDAVAAGILMLIAAPVHADDLKRRGMIGIQVAPVTEEAAKEAGLDSAKGILVPAVIPGMPAIDAGIEGGDIIYKVAGKDVPDMTAFLVGMRDFYAGDDVTFGIARNGEMIERTLKLAARPMESSNDYDVMYDSTTALGHRIRTIVTKPKGEGKSPAVVILPGLGMDALEFFRPTPNPFKSMIDGLTTSGYVTIRAHLIGAGDSEGPPSRDIDLKGEVACHRAAIEALKKYDFVDDDHIFIFGHSVGARIAPLVAAGENVSGIITYAALARPWMESSTESSQRRAEIEGFSADEIRAQVQQLQTFMQQCYIEKQSPAEVLAKYPELTELTSQFLQNDTYIMGRNYRYFQELAGRDAAADWKSLDAPILAIWGSADYVANKADSEFLVEQVNAAHPGNAEFVTIDGSDHSLNRMADMEESYLAGPAGAVGDFNSDVLALMKKWMYDRMSR